MCIRDRFITHAKNNFWISNLEHIIIAIWYGRVLVSQTWDTCLGKTQGKSPGTCPGKIPGRCKKKEVGVAFTPPNGCVLGVSRMPKHMPGDVSGHWGPRHVFQVCDTNTLPYVVACTAMWYSVGTVVSLLKDPSRQRPPPLKDHFFHAPMHFPYKLTSSGRPPLL